MDWKHSLRAITTGQIIYRGTYFVFKSKHSLPFFWDSLIYSTNKSWLYSWVFHKFCPLGIYDLVEELNCDHYNNSTDINEMQWRFGRNKKLHIWNQEKDWRKRWSLNWAWNTEMILTDWGCCKGFCCRICKMENNSFTHLLESLRELTDIKYVSTLHWQGGRALQMLSIVVKE